MATWIYFNAKRYHKYHFSDDKACRKWNEKCHATKTCLCFLLPADVQTTQLGCKKALAKKEQNNFAIDGCINLFLYII